jgi:NADPH:quinone reductase-like Zn-dependent oxidoreductase
LKPSNVSFIEAAGVALAGLTALQSLRIIVVKDRNVIIRGASGGVGTFGVQLARILGAKSIVAISSQVDLVANLGATEVKNYKTEKWEDTLKGRQFDGFFDCIGGYDSWQAAQLCLKHDGNYVTIVGDSAGPLTVGHLASTVGYNIARKFKSLFGVTVVCAIYAPRRHERS